MAHQSDPFSFSSKAFYPAAFSALPESVRSMAAQGFAQAQDNYQRFKQVADSNSGALEASYRTAARGVSDYAAKLVEITKTNTDEAFGFTRALMGSRSVIAACEVLNSHAQRQFELLTRQSKDLAALGRKVAADTVQPIQTRAAEAIKRRR
jgi:hypothetical protein